MLLSAQIRLFVIILATEINCRTHAGRLGGSGSDPAPQKSHLPQKPSPKARWVGSDGEKKDVSMLTTLSRQARVNHTCPTLGEGRAWGHCIHECILSCVSPLTKCGVLMYVARKVEAEGLSTRPHMVVIYTKIPKPKPANVSTGFHRRQTFYVIISAQPREG